MAAVLVWHTCMLSCVQCFVTPWTVVLQAPLSMRFSRQEYWSGLPSPSPGDLPDPGVKPELADDSLPLSHLGSPQHHLVEHLHQSSWLITRTVCEQSYPEKNVLGFFPEQ